LPEDERTAGSLVLRQARLSLLWKTHAGETGEFDFAENGRRPFGWRIAAELRVVLQPGILPEPVGFPPGARAG
jgi:hypothetical protein